MAVALLHLKLWIWASLGLSKRRSHSHHLSSRDGVKQHAAQETGSTALPLIIYVEQDP